MASSEIDKEIRARIDAFLGEISELVREAALEAVQDALSTQPGAAPAARRAPAQRRTAAKARRTAKRSGKRIRRSPADLEKLGTRILSHIKSHPGCRMEEISAALGESTYELRRPLEMLKASKAFKTTGQKRATQYYPTGAATPAKAKKATTKKKRKTKAK